MKLTTRNILGYLISIGYSVSGLVRKNRNKILNNCCIATLCFHNPSKEFFTSCILWLKQNGFNFISINELLAIARGELDFPMGAVLLTFDDGWRNNKENVAAVANSLKVPVTIFATTEPIEYGEAYWWTYMNVAKKRHLINSPIADLKKIKNTHRVCLLNRVKSDMFLNAQALTTNDLIEMNASKYITFGSHTVSHPILPMCSDQESFFEIKFSKTKLEQILDTRVDGFAYPNGDFSIREINYLQKSGYKLAFTTKPNLITYSNIRDLYTLPRFNMLEDASIAENICRMTGVWFTNQLLYKK
jgi:peptidoglycan/xylan/chitin deacetylase (PgdA/CDA1 family)